MARSHEDFVDIVKIKNPSVEKVRKIHIYEILNYSTSL